MADAMASGSGPASGAVAHRALLEASDPDPLRCCCGRDDCVFLRHNCTILEGVEKDVHNAAKMGQALLDRHEAYMASAERDRSELTARIEELEMANSGLEAENKRAADENSTLQDQLELLSTEVRDAETKAGSLEAALRETQVEVRRLEAATAQAAALERHIILLEEEQAALQNTLSLSEEEARTAIYRWKKAERAIMDLQEQLEKIEKEGREERERHYEVLGRMEKQRAMEKDLDAAAGRLKGAAAAKSIHSGKGGTVVSHFVRDLLQDNANLQIGIAELREMLMNSNDEIQMLREQLQYHQPVAEGEASAASTLRAELEHKEPPVQNISQELHIHHHYHVTHNHQDVKKPKKKRQGLTPGIFTPPHGSSSPSTPGRLRLSRASPAPALVSHRHNDSLASGTSMPSNPRWSLLSENPSDFQPSSVPSSPLSSHRNSMFDRGIMEMSFPGSPTTSVDPVSPSWRLSHNKRASEVSAASIPAMGGLPPTPENPHQRPERTPRPPAIHIAQASSLADLPLTGDVPGLSSAATATDDSTIDSASAEEDETHSLHDTLSPIRSHFDPLIEQRPTLRRVVSHESIMSLSGGLDIHTLKARPSQLTLRQLGATSAGTDISAITARPMLATGSPSGRAGSMVLKDSLVGLGLPMPRVRDRVVSGPGEHATLTPRSSSGALGRIVSWRPWASNSPSQPQPSPDPSPATTPTAPVAPIAITAPALLSPTLASVSTSSTPTAMRSPAGSHHGTGNSHGPGFKERDLSRAPGINQPGSIPGFHEYWAAHQRKGPASRVRPDSVDQDALREVLDEQ